MFLQETEKTVQAQAVVLCPGTVFCFAVLHNPIHGERCKQSRTRHWYTAVASYSERLRCTDVVFTMVVERSWTGDTRKLREILFNGHICVTESLFENVDDHHAIVLR